MLLLLQFGTQEKAKEEDELWWMEISVAVTSRENSGTCGSLSGSKETMLHMEKEEVDQVRRDLVLDLNVTKVIGSPTTSPGPPLLALLRLMNTFIFNGLTVHFSNETNLTEWENSCPI